MSTSLSTFLTCWNETMSTPIRESDLKNINEMSFRRLLISVLKELFVDTTAFETMDTETGSRLRSSRIRFVATVNHFYKIANPGAQDLCLLDLIQPSFKKSFSVLHYCQNYCAFVRQTYQSTILDLKDKLQERDQLRTARNTLRKELEEAKIKEENNVKAIKDLDQKIPRQREKLAEAQTNVKSLKAKTASIKEDIQMMEMNFLESKNQAESVKLLIVSDEEAQSILKAMESLEREIEEQNEIAASYHQKYQDNSKAIKEVSEIVEKMEALLAQFKSIDAGEIKADKKRHDTLRIEDTRLRSIIATNRSQIERLSHNIAMKREALAQLHKKVEDAEKMHNVKKAESKKELKGKRNLMRKLALEEAGLHSTYKRLLDDRNRSFKVTTNVMKHISNSLFEDD